MKVPGYALVTGPATEYVTVVVPLGLHVASIVFRPPGGEEVFGERWVSWSLLKLEG
jgi:hypothetical protein